MNSINEWVSRKSLQILTAGAALVGLSLLSGCSRIAVSTYHYDNLRTGWNENERRLKPSNVNASSLEVLTLQLDDTNDQVDTQPLIVPRVKIAGHKHDVVYVATENNNVYAIDADTDTKLLKVNLGTAVPWPIGCGNNGPSVGIDGTPVIDLASRTLYVIAYILDPANGNAPEYYIHALDLSTLGDKVPPRKVTASSVLSNNQPFAFNATYQRQRPGLLLANGNVYAGFGSFCDWGGNQSRGWVLGWQAGSLTPLAANELNNRQPTEPNNMFLSSVWESGYALAEDPSGNIYFTTGNSDSSGTTYDGVTNIQESVVKLKSDITRPGTPPPFLFTPANESGLGHQRHRRRFGRCDGPADSTWPSAQPARLQCQRWKYVFTQPRQHGWVHAYECGRAWGRAEHWRRLLVRSDLLQRRLHSRCQQWRGLGLRRHDKQPAALGPANFACSQVGSDSHRSHARHDPGSRLLHHRILQGQPRCDYLGRLSADDQQRKPQRLARSFQRHSVGKQAAAAISGSDCRKLAEPGRECQHRSSCGQWQSVCRELHGVGHLRNPPARRAESGVENDGARASGEA